MAEKKNLKYINGIFSLLIVCVFAYFFIGEVFLESDSPDSSSFSENYMGEWKQVMPDGDRIPIEIPGKCHAERNEVVTIETRLPETIQQTVSLCFRSAKQDMKFYIDGELRQQFSTRDTSLFGKTSAMAYVFLMIHEDDAGKILLIETQTDSSYSGIFYPVYYGNPLGVWNYLFKQYGTELIVAFITLLLSVITIIGSIVFKLCCHRKIALEYLGWGILIVAVWLVTNSAFRQLIFPKLSVANDIAFFMVMLLPIPYLLYLNEIQKGRYQKIYALIGSGVVFDFVVCTILHATRQWDFTDTIIYMAVFCVLTILFLIVTILVDIWKGYIKEYPFVAVGMSGMCIAAFIQLVSYFRRTRLFSGVILAVGLIFFLLFAIISTIDEIMYMNTEKQQALLASQSKGRFLANMSHEIRTPINAVLGMDAMILRESKDAQIKEYALDIQNAGQSLLSLINDILDLSKIESGKLEILPVEYDFSSLVHDIMNMIRMKAQDKNIAINLSIDKNLPSRLWGDDVRLRQILVNLMNNAVKYTEKGSVTLTISGIIQEDNISLTFQVEDTGIGIQEEDIPKLYAAFERIEEQRNRNIEGTGLGMNITVQLLELMGSKLQVESVYGEGSRFFFTLEQKIMDTEPIGNLEQRIHNQATGYSYQAMFIAPDANVLVVDDNAVNRKVFINLLKATKINVDEAAGGLECLELVRKKPYDIIFLDHMMPDLDGIETLHQMRELEDYPCQSAPVIALTANAVTGAKEMYLAEGFHSFLSKPVDPEKLEKMLMENLPDDKVLYEKIQEDSSTSIESMSAKYSPTESSHVSLEETQLPQIDGIDWEYALLHTKDFGILKDTLHDFYDIMDSEAALLEQFFKLLTDSKEQRSKSEMEQYEEAVRQFRIKVHSMKSSAAMIGAVPLSGIAKMLEYAARDDKIDVIEKIVPAFLEEWHNMKELLKPCINQETKEHAEEKPKADYDMTKEYLRLLKAAMEDMDVDTADEIMNQIKRFQYPEIAATVIENLGLAVTNLDVEQTVTCIEKFEMMINQMEAET